MSEPERETAKGKPAGAGVSSEWGGPAPTGAGAGLGLPFDPLRLILAAWCGRWLTLGGAALMGFLGFLAGWMHFQTRYTVAVQLIRREIPNTFRAGQFGEAFQPAKVSIPTLMAMMRAPSLLAKVGKEMKPPAGVSELRQNLVISRERNTDLITVTLSSTRGKRQAAELINRYANAVVELTRTLQSQEAAEINRFLQQQLAAVEKELAALNQELLRFSAEADFYSSDKQVEAYLRDLSAAEQNLQQAELSRDMLKVRIEALEKALSQQNPQKTALQSARRQLESLLTQYTEQNPLVQEQQARVRALEEALKKATNSVESVEAAAAGTNTVAVSLYLDLVNYRAQLAGMEGQLKKLQEFRNEAFKKLQALPEKDLRYARLKARKLSLETTRDLLAARQREAELYAANSPGYYRLFAPASPDDVEVSGRAVKIAVVTVAGAVFGAGLLIFAAMVRELFDDRIWTSSDARRTARAPVLAQLGDLDEMDAEALALWRFRTWSAVRKHLRETVGPAPCLVFALTSTRPGEGKSVWVRLLQEAALERQWRAVAMTNAAGAGAEGAAIQVEKALEEPASVLEAVRREEAATIVTPPDFGWGIERRAQWRRALDLWMKEPRLAVIAELPPLQKLESMLLAETFPAVFWLAASGRTRQSEAGPLLSAARVAEINVSGVFVNRILGVLAKLPDLSRFGLALACGLGLWAGSGLRAQETSPDQVRTNAPVFSAAAAGPRLAPWQQRLTLGPGDVLNIAVYGHPELARNGIAVGPDGRISFLLARDVMAAGLTVDELRERLNEELAKYYRNLRVMVYPVAWRSKKYFLLGTVLDRGAYYLDRPMTIIEAVAQARGIAVGLQDLNTIEIADLSRAFLIRRGKRMPVDFVKLFQQGDLSQNVQLEPGDYLYFPSALVNEVYVLGAVASPGVVGVTEKSTVLGVITKRGGFSPKADRQRVLVVRGSLSNPEPHVINVSAILHGKGKDFPVQPRDIIYVADRPWARAEELADMAVRAFVQTMSTTWGSANIGPVITEPILPELK